MKLDIKSNDKFKEANQKTTICALGNIEEHECVRPTFEGQEQIVSEKLIEDALYGDIPQEYKYKGQTEAAMENKEKRVANLDVEDAFAWGMFQKIRILGQKQISIEELCKFADAVIELSKAKLKFIPKFSFGQLEFDNFFNRYGDYVTANNDIIKLNEKLEAYDLFDIFSMGIIPLDMVKIMKDKELGKKVFKKPSEMGED